MVLKGLWNLLGVYIIGSLITAAWPGDVATVEVRLPLAGNGMM